MIDAATFQSLRPHLFSVAYRMLGSASDAEDVVQDAWLRAASAPAALESARAWLTTVVTRLCLDRLKSARARREEYVGPWLPEPVPTGAVDSADTMLSRHESVTMAFLVLLESLSPLERAVFLLREVFDYEYADIAQITGRDEAACRQLFSRAKKHISDHRPRFPASPEAHAKMVGRFMEACLAGDMDGLMSLLAEDVTAWSDGGGKVRTPDCDKQEREERTEHHGPT